MTDVRVAVAGVGNCANCLIQGAEFLRSIPPQELGLHQLGLMTDTVCGFGPGSVKVVLGFDVDERKVGTDLREAMWAEPNVADKFFMPESDLGPVLHGPVIDGIGKSMSEKVAYRAGRMRQHQPLLRPELVQALEDHGIDVLVNFLPVGSEFASQEYAYAALDAGVAFVNAIPVWIARNDEIRAQFTASGVPLIGDDIKSQVGATILHRAIAEVFQSRGAQIDRTYQLNFGGNTDFYNMKDEERLATKRESKTSAVTSVADVDADKIHIGPSGYVEFLRDEKIAFIQVEGTGFVGNKLEVELRYSGQDSPNSAGVVYDAVRWAMAAGQLPDGVPHKLLIRPASAWLMKAPPVQIPDSEAAERCATLALHQPSEFISLEGEEIGLETPSAEPEPA